MPAPLKWCSSRRSSLEAPAPGPVYNRRLALDLSGRVAPCGRERLAVSAGELVAPRAERGAAVAITWNAREDLAREVQTAIVANARRAQAELRNVADEQAVQDMVKRVESSLGPVDILVNNAGVTRDTHIMMMDAARWNEVRSVNLDGAFHRVRATIRGMLVRRWGRVINITSPSASMPLPGQTNYAASKAGLVGFTCALARCRRQRCAGQSPSRRA